MRVIRTVFVCTNTVRRRIEIRANEEAKSLIEKAASLTGETLSSYILSRSLSSALKDLFK
ncbi:MAG: hypothetical protein B6241_13930 [Spirochaetaceae bacterium 4572_59]|nr:MAG: hypothetical protein B6241_13930 [Spirochaetaceae bacterium 4572_59]